MVSADNVWYGMKGDPRAGKTGKVSRNVSNNARSRLPDERDQQGMRREEPRFPIAFPIA
jgi:hypothetical protein